MFEKDKWKKINLESYAREKYEEKRDDNSIIKLIDQSKLNNLEIEDSLINGIPFAIKDNFAIKNTLTTAASKIIREFRTSYNSTVFNKLIKKGGVPLFKTNLDELAMGGTGLTSNYGPVYNPFDKRHLVGGSSSGSNYVVADKTVPFSIGSDTGDSVRKPAAHTGVVGFKPTWGLVSRYGLYDFAPSWDSVGWFTNTIKEAAVLMDILKGYDPKDQSSLHSEEKDYFKDIETKDKFRIVVIPELEKQIIDKVVLDDYKKTLNALKEDGHEIIEVVELDLKVLSTIFLVYKVVSSTEAFSCNSNLTGFHFGNYFNNEGKNYDEKIFISRTKGFGYEAKKRFLLSQEARYSNEKEYEKAVKMRRLINEEINRILSLGDVLIVPTVPNLADDIESINSFPVDQLLPNILTLFNSNGSPSLTMPVTRNGHLSTSINISSLPFNDKRVFQVSNRLEEIL